MGRIGGVSLEGNRIGKIIVLEEDNNFPDVPISELTDFEYFFFNETTLQGVPREANIPASNNNDWQQVTNIPVSNLNGTQASGLTLEGMFSVYELNEQIQFKVQNHYTVPERKIHAKLGDELQFTQDGNLYRLSVSSKGAGSQYNAGSIHFIKHGTETKNAVLESYNWQLDIDPQFRGDFHSSVFYKQNEIVEYQSRLQSIKKYCKWKCICTADWESVTDGTALLGLYQLQALIQ